MRTAKVYTLQDKETGMPFYVGCTTQPLKQRFAGHTHKSKASSIELLEEVSLQDSLATEIFWFNQMKCWGFELVNINEPSKLSMSFGNENLLVAASSKLKAISSKVSSTERQAAEYAFNISKQTIDKYLRGNGMCLGTSCNLLKFFNAVIQSKQSKVA